MSMVIAIGSKTSVAIKAEIEALETKLAPLDKQIEDLRAASETAETVRSSHAFAALIENDADSSSHMAQLEGKQQQMQADVRNLESAIRVGNERLSDLRAQLASAVRSEKIQACRALCDEAKVSDAQLQKLAAPLLKAVAKSFEAEQTLRTSLRELGEILLPKKMRKSLEAPAVEHSADVPGSPVAILLAHILGSVGVLDGVEIGKRDENMLRYYTGRVDVIERELDKLQPQTSKDAAA